MWIELLAAASLACGTFFMLVAALGVLRLPDFYLRIHAPTKAATLGMILLLLGVVLALPEAGVLPRAILAMAFVGLTAPVSAHVLARAAYRRGLRPRRPLERDDYGARLSAAASPPSGDSPQQPPAPPDPMP